ncbi:phosphoribosylamine--glycine ligase [Fictibacillus macauensis ZFHKF-1]|uniref:Phosphoribosylamine--glycine ligase n=1 Tax=Fictibacillus macauensis ZFHKF-1 TaxID=1196324 RepID=I8AHG5_9BACL|nr:phosphoribosylamine--glycine ligase [Fictibacillus macauensis]EIT84889.1 phosphoribosylamine--glycine ligase [Fictibacillus macauensis ZFHKF-1]
MNVLVVGKGGREHTIAWRFKQSASVQQVYVAPGNPGMSDVAECVDISEHDHEALIAFARDHEIALTFVGAEGPLLAGLVDDFKRAGLTVFGPSAEAALIEGSKSFAKDLMKKYNIPTAAYEVFHNYEAALAYIHQQGAPIVLKADGLAAGKGVTVAMTIDEAERALKSMMKDEQFGDAGKAVVIEAFLQGEEFSYMAFVNGSDVYPMVIAQDHKRAFDGDAGPNTGGMGAYSPVPHIATDVVDYAKQQILQATADALVEEGRPFTGVLYAGLIATENGPKVIEFNARFGDPETQVVLPRLEGDFAQVLLAILQGNTVEMNWSQDAYLGVVLAAKGYPGSYKKGQEITGCDALQADTLLFHAGIKKQDSKLITDGGRVLLVACKAPTVLEAQRKVYREMQQLTCEGSFYRTDIGNRAIGALI